MQIETIKVNVGPVQGIYNAQEKTLSLLEGSSNIKVPILALEELIELLRDLNLLK